MVECLGGEVARGCPLGRGREASDLAFKLQALILETDDTPTARVIRCRYPRGRTKEKGPEMEQSLRIVTGLRPKIKSWEITITPMIKRAVT